MFGHSVLRIVTGSMEPEIPTDTYILVKECPADEIQKGDIISFYSEEPSIYGLPNTHRVVDILVTPEGIEFVTKGDSNVTEDRVNVREERLIGVYLGKMEILTKFSVFLMGNGIFAVIIILQVAIIGIIVFSIFKKEPEQESKSEKESDDHEEKQE